jgi:hypothetical protein
MSRVRWGGDGTRGVTAVRSAKSPALPTQVRILSSSQAYPGRLSIAQALHACVVTHSADPGAPVFACLVAAFATGNRTSYEDKGLVQPE